MLHPVGPASSGSRAREAATYVGQTDGERQAEVLTRFGRQWLETRLDNWALVDTFCGSVLSPLLEQHPEVEATLREWSRARGLWVRRGALVTLVPFARRAELLDAACELAREHLGDPEDLIHKAVGWLLREAGKTDKARLRDYLRQHGPAIPRTTVRYAIERFSEGERRRLLEETRHSTLPLTRNGNGVASKYLIRLRAGGFFSRGLEGGARRIAASLQ